MLNRGAENAYEAFQVAQERRDWDMFALIDNWLKKQ